MIEWLSRTWNAIKNWSSRHRIAILFVAAVAFFLGMAWSIAALELQWSATDGYALTAVLFLSSLSLSLNAYELRLCAMATGGQISFRDALSYSSTATVANMLPVPASSLIRGGALLKSGATITEASKMIVAAGLIWLSMASILTALALFSGWLGFVTATLATTISLALAVWIAKKSDVSVAIQFVAVRAVMIGLLMLRLWLCFIAINAVVSLFDTAIFSIAGIVGNAAAIVPAGLGIAEGLGALLAPAAGAVPAAAFLALGLNRLIGLGGSGIVSLYYFGSVKNHQTVRGAS